jgi:glycosyltransferase involved in cell wall biosynthesis
MRILWYSNAPFVSTGYGLQTRLAIKHLTNLGHKLAVACNYGLRGAMAATPEGVPLYPGGYEPNTSNDVVQAHADDFGAEVIVSLYDAWPLNFLKLKTPWVAWLPVDHEPAPARVVEALRGKPGTGKAGPPARGAVSFSAQGQKALCDAGLPDSAYIPLGVETDVYTPGDKAEARERLGLPTDRFIVGVVAANKAYPSRKSLPQILQAFAVLKANVPEALLYMHTSEGNAFGGVSVWPIARSLGLGRDSVVLCDQYEYLRGGFVAEYMRDAFRSFDVLASPSMSEGFGLPIVEAQACGCPVIVTDFSSMPELLGGGWLIDEYERWWSEHQGAWVALPHVSAIADSLLQAYRLQTFDPGGYAVMQEAARGKALEYDFAGVVAPAWHKYLEGLGL